MRFERAIQEVTSATTKVERMPGRKYYISVFYKEDSTANHGRIKSEAYKVLGELESRGFEHVEFGGRKDMGHSGLGCGFAVSKKKKTTSA